MTEICLGVLAFGLLIGWMAGFVLGHYHGVALETERRGPD
jgi:hypothetical protein